MSSNIFQSHSSPYNYERTVSPTFASLSLLSPNGGPPHQSHGSHPAHNIHPHSPIKMNGNISSRTTNLSPFKSTQIMNLSSNSKQPLVDISRTSLNPRTSPQLNGSRVERHSPKASASNDNTNSDSIVADYGLHEMLASLALMCLLSLLMAFLALFFLQKTCHITGLTDEPNSDISSKVNRNLNQMRIVSNTKEYVRVFQISVSLSTLTISLDLCCLFVCCIQFLSAVKLMKTQFGRKRTFEFLKKTSHIRVAAIGAFLISIPIFFTGVILFTFVNFDEVPALATSVIIGIGIVFCGIASVQTVYLWQWEKTKASREMSESRIIQLRDSSYLPTIELSTLV